jgi:spore coat protein U-like protein
LAKYSDRLDSVRSIAICKVHIKYAQNIVRKLSIVSTVVGIAAVFSTITPAVGQSVNVGANIGKSCTAPGNYTVTLPNYDGTDRPGSASIKFKCTKNTPYTIELFPGNGMVKSSSGTLTLGRGGATPIAYTIKVGSTLVNTFTGRGSGLGPFAGEVGATPVIHPTAGQDPEPGLYSDTIGIKVTY